MSESYRGDKSESITPDTCQKPPESVQVDRADADWATSKGMARELYSLALQSLPYPICLIDANDYTVKLANSAAGLDMTGPTQKCYQALHQRNTPCHEAGEPCPVEIVRSTQMPIIVEHVHTDSRGNQRYFEVHGYPVFDVDGNVESIIEYSLDVTERRHAEEALRESEARWRSVMEHAPDLIHVVDREGKIIYVNRPSEGVGPAGVVGDSIYDTVSPTHRKLVRRTIEGVFATGRSDRYELTTTMPDGSIIWQATRLGPISNNSEISAVILMSRDITERKRAEELLVSAHRDLRSSVADSSAELEAANEQLQTEVAEREQIQKSLAESEQLHRVVLTLISDAVLVCDDDGRLKWIGPNAESFFGLSADDLEDITRVEELLGADLFAPEQLAEQGELSNIKQTIINHNGQARTLLVSVKQVNIKGGTTLYTCRDVTRLDQVEQALRSVNEELKLERQTLWQKNTALKEILGQIEDEKKRMASQIHININRVALPILNSLNEKVSGEGQYFVSLLKSTLVDLTSPFVSNLEKTCSKLTPRELEICQMIKAGLTSKEIASTLNNSVETVLKQRKSIRKKLGISGQDVNLVTHLKSLDRE